MAQPASAGDGRVTETVLSWVHGPDAQQVRSQTDQWGPTQWRHARRAIEIHGVAPLIHAALQRQDALGAVHPNLARDVAREHAANARRVMTHRAAAKQLLALGNEIGLPMVSLREAAFAFHYHAEPTLRPAPGVDVLVRPREEPRLVSALVRAGWREVLRSIGPPVIVHAERQCDCAAGLPQAPEPCHLEVWTSVDYKSSGIRFDLTWAYWYDARPELHDGTPGLAPSPLRLLQHVLIQASHRLMALRLRMLDLWDLAAVGRTLVGSDWETLVGEAQDQGEERLFWAPLRLAERYLGPIAPEAVMATLRAAVPRGLRDWVEAMGADDFAEAGLNDVAPARRTRWCRSTLERLLAIRQLLLPFPSEVTSRNYLRAYYHHLQGLARWLRFMAAPPIRGRSS
jgi:hypothetical protein